MSNVNNQLITILRGFLHESSPEPQEPWDASMLLQIAGQQNLLPVLAYENKRRRLFDRHEVNQQLNKLLYGTIAGNLNRHVSFEALSKKLSANGIEHMPVKGYYLRQMYPVPELRTFGDIDLLIHEDDRKKVHELMQSLGYAVEHDWEPTYSYRKSAEHYEFHTNLMDGNLDGRTDLQEYFSSAWEHAKPDEGLRFKPDSDFHLIYIVCHLAKHLYGGGAGLRMYLDIAFYIRNYDKALDWNKITDEFNRLNLGEFFYTVMNVCCLWFGVETSCPLPEADCDALDRLLSYTLDSDLFGHSRDHSVIQLRGKSEKKNSKVRIIGGNAFPPVSEISSRYTFLQRCPWLLPLAWFIRLFVNLKRLPKKIRDLRRIAATDTDRVDSYDLFMKRLGL